MKAMIPPKGYKKPHKWGVPHVYYKDKPDFLWSISSWQTRGWKPRPEAPVYNWTFWGKSAHRLYHIRDCEPIGGEKAKSRRELFGFTLERVEKLKAETPYQLRMPI